jgi:hypothetical protein
MGTTYGHRIVTDGLVLHLDAANTKSYPGTGTTWYDLSGNGNDGSLVNGPVYDSDNCGSLVFDGVDDSGIASNPLLENEFSISSWIYPINVSTGVGRIVASTYQWSGGGTNQRGWTFGINYGVGESFYFRVYNNVGAYVTCYRYNLWRDHANSWVYLTGIYSESQDTLYLYENFDLHDSKPLNSLVMENSSFGLGISRRIDSASQGLWSGNISNVKIYNRALSQAEVTQNFKALKGRYGL